MTDYIKETLFSGSDNTFTVEYTINGSLYDFTNTTNVEFILNGISIDSITQASYFDFSVGTDGRIIFKLGQAGYKEEDSGQAIVKVYDATNTNGVIFSSPEGGTNLDIIVFEES